MSAAVCAPVPRASALSRPITATSWMDAVPQPPGRHIHHRWQVIFSSTAETEPPPCSDISEGYEVLRASSHHLSPPFRAPPASPALSHVLPSAVPSLACCTGSPATAGPVVAPGSCAELLTDLALGSLRTTVQAPFPATAVTPGSLSFLPSPGPRGGHHHLLLTA